MSLTVLRVVSTLTTGPRGEPRGVHWLVFDGATYETPIAMLSDVQIDGIIASVTVQRDAAAKRVAARQKDSLE